MLSGMNLLAVNWLVDPTIFSIGGREIRWYGLLFGLGLLIIGPLIAQRIWKREQLPQAWFDKLWWTVILSTIIGARLGHCLFYDPGYYLANPLDIFKIWEGGLASHGGTIGIIIGVWIYSRRVTHKSIVWTLDRLAVPVGQAAALIRLGNLMNHEIYGYPTDLPWGFHFITNIDAWRHGAAPVFTPAVHPTAIYEALCYLAVFALCMWLYFGRDAARRRPGLILGTFLTGVFVARVIIERLKVVQEPWELDMVAAIGLNQGQMLSIPFVIAGVWLIIKALRRPAIIPSDNPSKS